MENLPKIDESLVRRLIAAQFPEWSELPIKPVVPGGWDNRTFRLGEKMLVRIPSAEAYATQVEREQRWLLRFAPNLPLPIPTPLAMGKPALGYPWCWSVYSWLDGEQAHPQRLNNLSIFARELGGFLCSLQSVDATGGPLSGPHNFHRGGSLSVYEGQTKQSIAMLGARVDGKAVARIWDAALKTAWNGPPVWVHGDISAGNLLVREGRLCGVIDFGQLCLGDPACDLAMAWTFLDGDSRETFRATLSLDAGTWTRGCAWALWKALIVAAGLVETNVVETSHSWQTINTILADY